MASVLFRPLTRQWRMQKRWTDGSRMGDVAAIVVNLDSGA
jgi:hypothetical protein